MSAAYDTFDYPSYWEGREYEHESELIALKSYLNQIPKIKTIADVGCGYGRLTPCYIHRVKKIYLVDPSRRLLGIAKKTMKGQFGKSFKKTRVDIIQSRIENLPKKIKNKSLDVLILVRVMHHLEDINKDMAILGKLIKDGGYLIIEYPNKLHWKALLKKIVKGDLTFPLDIFPEDKRSPGNLKGNCLPFFNYHPDIIKEALNKNKFQIIETRSVSNVRSKFFKKNFPYQFLISLEDMLQKPLGRLKFGPSIFVLARKRD